MAVVSARRIVTGLAPDGRSCVLADAPLARGPGEISTTIWQAPRLPVDEPADVDLPPAPFSFDTIHSGGVAFSICEFPADFSADFHATDTVDFITMLEGELVLRTESGEVTLRAGDVAVDRGIVHGWRNDSGKPARATIVLVPARPLGAGGTV